LIKKPEYVAPESPTERTRKETARLAELT
jgi:hypothetical protein